MTAPTPQPAPSTSTPAQTIPSGTRTASAKPQLDLSMAQQVRAKEPLALPQQDAPLPAEVQSQINTFWTALQAAETAYNTLATGYVSIWESGQYPVDYRQRKAAEFMDAVFTKQAADLQRAETALKAAHAAVRAGLTPPLLGDPTTHELKLLNAREEVRMALEGLQPRDQLDRLVSLFGDALEGGETPIAYLIGGTETYKRLLRDEAARLAFAEKRPDLLKRLLPPTAEGYFRAGPALDALGDALDLARDVRVFTARDNGVTLPEVRR